MKEKRSPIPFRIISLILTLGWMGLIFYLSHQTSGESSSLSGGLIEGVVKFLFPNASAATLEAAVSGLQFIVRKGAHFGAFTILGIFSCMAFITYKIPLPVKGAIGFTVAVIYAASDEYHQTFIEGRSGELRDIIIDSCGALLGVSTCIGIYLLTRKFMKRDKKMRKKQYMKLCDNLLQRIKAAEKEKELLLEEISSLKEKIDLQAEEIAALKESKALETKPEETSLLSSEETEEIEKIEEAEKVEESKEEEEPITISEPQLSEEVNNAAKIIGKIVLSAATYCNNLTAIDTGSNVKELVNLILGRSEVAKAEILRISALKIDPEQKLKAMEMEQNEAEDYFKSVMAQK